MGAIEKKIEKYFLTEINMFRECCDKINVHMGNCFLNVSKISINPNPNNALKPFLAGIPDF